jgi:3-methyladenine DNA glycosylase/8-oxoguanine DNA glycosylase
MTTETRVRPQGPYSLALSARHASDATRTFRDGVFRALIGGEVARAWQAPDGTVSLYGSPAAVEHLRWQLALDEDHTDFLRAMHGDPLLHRAALELRGLRPIRTGSVAQSLLRALCGQLIESRRARALERQIIRIASPRGPEGLHAPPTCAELGRFSPSELRALGLHARRAAALVRVCRSLELERLHELPTAVVAARLERERCLGPWSVGVICIEGLGRFDNGLVGDLGLIKLTSALRGGWATASDTADLLAPYGGWQGIASVYLLTAYGRGLIPLKGAAARAA